MSRLDQLLYLLRIPLCIVALLFILYCAFYLWLFIPYEDFTYAWRPDSRLVVIDVPTESLAAGKLRPGDVVIEVGENPIRRLRPVYPAPLQPLYEYTILREGVLQTEDIAFSSHVTPLSLQLRLPVVVLSLIGWLVGSVMMYWASRSNWQALRSGSILLFSAVVAIGIYASLNGVPATWIIGYQAIFFLGPLWAYLGLLPRLEPVSKRTNELFAVFLLAAGILSLVAGFEALFLYPRLTSIGEITGVSIYSLGLTLSGLGLLTSIVLLVLRAIRLERCSYLRQQIVFLLSLIALGMLPIVLLTILPLVLFDFFLLPFQISVILLTLVPMGYLFVIYRKGLLGLDIFFSRSIHILLLTLIAFGIYVLGIYLLESVTGVSENEAVILAALLFLPTLLLSVYISRPVQTLVDWLIFGDVSFSQDILAEYATRLATKPEYSTLDNIVSSLSTKLSASRAYFGVKVDKDSFKPISTIGIDSAFYESSVHQSLDLLILRSSKAARIPDNQQILNAFPWAEVVLPVKVRDEQIGLLALSRPGIDGYFNAKQVAFLNQAAGVLAVAAENIALFETTRKLSSQRLSIQDQERRELSRQIHDEPLQRITYATFLIDQLLTKYYQESQDRPADSSSDLINGADVSKLVFTAEQLRRAAGSLREVCMGLHPPFHDQGAELAARDVVNTFESEYGMNIDYVSKLGDVNQTISEQVTFAISRVLKEALNNVHKHAKGADVRVTLGIDSGNALVLTVADGGPGSQVAQLSFSELVRRHHLGIVGMHEWAQQIGGNLQILPNKPTGTVVKLQCPLGVAAT